MALSGKIRHPRFLVLETRTSSVGENSNSRRQLEPQLHRRDDGDILLPIQIVENEPAAMAFEIDRLTVLPPGHVVPAIRVREMPLTAIIEMDETIPHETEMPALESFSVHVNTFNDFTE